MHDLSSMCKLALLSLFMNFLDESIEKMNFKTTLTEIYWHNIHFIYYYKKWY
jgi:hypothetical protein